MAAMVFSLSAETLQETFKQAWRLKEEGDKAEKIAQPQIAVEKYSAALQILQGIQKNSPEWDPKLVNYHARDCTLHIARNTRKLGAQTESSSVKAPVPSEIIKNTPSASTSASVPTVEQVVEESIPTAGIAKAPRAEVVDIPDVKPPLVYEPSSPFATEPLKPSVPPASALVESTPPPSVSSAEAISSPSNVVTATAGGVKDVPSSDLEARLRRTEDELRQMQEMAEEHSRALLRDNSSLKQRLAETEDALYRSQNARSSSPASSSNESATVITDDKELQAKLNDLNRQLQEKESEIYALRTSSSTPSAVSVRTDIPKDIEQRLRETEEELRRAVELAEEHSRSLIKDNNYLRDQLLTFEDSLNLSKRELETVKSELKAKVDEYIVMKDRLEKAESDLKNGFPVDDARVQSLLAENQKLRGEIEALRDQGNADIAALKTENDVLKKRIDDLLKDSKSSSYQMVKLEIDKALKQLRNMSPDERRNLEAQLLEKKVQAAEGELQSTSDKLIALNEEKNKLLQAKKEIEERAKKAEELVKSAQHPVNEQIAKLTKDNSDLTKELADLKRDIRLAKVEGKSRKVDKPDFIEIEQPAVEEVSRSVDQRLSDIEKYLKNLVQGNADQPGDRKLRATIRNPEKYPPTEEDVTIVRRAITGTVIRLDPKENFVVINFGSGYVPPLHSELDVYREGQVVGSIRITNPIKPPFASANILAGTLRHGDVIR